MTRLEELAAVYADRRVALETTRDALRREVIAACDAGMTETEAARIAGVSRMTVRAWRRED